MKPLEEMSGTMNGKEAMESVVIKFAGDSGDGMQLAGTLFTDTVAVHGKEIATFPDFPSEIRAPQGTVAGVSGFQVHFGSSGVHGPGDAPDVLVAMNPAALKSNLKDLRPACTIVVDRDSFGKRDLDKAGFATDPLEDGTLDGHQVLAAPITSMTKAAIADAGLDNKTADRCKNMFALGMVYRLFDQPMDQTIGFFQHKFKKSPTIAEANIRALKAGHNYVLTMEAVPATYTVQPAARTPGTYRNITGNQALAWGLMAGAKKAGKDLFLGSYPITPATDIMQELAKHKWAGVKVLQAEDEIAGICSAIGASFAGDVAVTTTSGPGMALKTEAIGLAVMTELPLVIVNVQRGGPSTGLPTKTEQSDLLQAVWGRNGESPVVVLAASTPAACFDRAVEAIKIATEHMTPVILLSESYVANGAEPWKVKALDELPAIHPPVLTQPDPAWTPYGRDPATLARKWVVPGTPALQHRIGGLEKDECTGCVSHDPQNHEAMVALRRQKVERVADFIPEQKFRGKGAKKLLVVGWGGQFGTLFGAVTELRSEGKDIAVTHFNHIHPLPRNTASIFEQFEKIVVCELNSGQFANYLRAVLPQFTYLQYNKVKGRPFKVSELKDKFNELLAQ
ncbi:MAG TPA: 2-oxoacid:acceptor oxidoreductase subunit alpha [Flavobacteriales bacterium]|nr:2-oxoacid:acceptor oxidoreductase subunit alpha [Flavobacteriales bacterium]HNI02981.1 2-oxoacid:acceptor oxidoreductase subunit alpha [Flavobacteriales bacterium]HRT52644.1 2-oxoacid:acceptor oxidoreductase subunit alpha [Flavobacteriales bacterium]